MVEIAGMWDLYPHTSRFSRSNSNNTGSHEKYVCTNNVWSNCHLYIWCMDYEELIILQSKKKKKYMYK